MTTNLDALEELVTRAEERLGALHAEVERLSIELRERPAPRAERGPSARIADENRRLLEERALVLERIRGLIREIDRAL